MLAVVSLRLVGFAVAQALIALALVVAGRDDAWAASAPWWPLAATATSVATFLVVRALLHLEGKRYRDFFAVATAHLRGDLLVVVGLVVLAVVLGLVPNYALATVLYGDADVPFEILIQPLPHWAAILTVAVFPVSIAATELPAYFGYARPRLEDLTGRPWVAVGVTAGFLALQHASLPLVFDYRFAAWRALAYLPLALVFALTLRWRPRLLLYLVGFTGWLTCRPRCWCSPRHGDLMRADASGLSTRSLFSSSTQHPLDSVGWCDPGCWSRCDPGARCWVAHVLPAVAASTEGLV